MTNMAISKAAAPKTLEMAMTNPWVFSTSSDSARPRCAPA